MDVDGRRTVCVLRLEGTEERQACVNGRYSANTSQQLILIRDANLKSRRITYRDTAFQRLITP